MYVIIRKNGAYYHNKGRIILFETIDEAENFINMFAQYSMQRLMQTDPLNSVGAPMQIASESKIIPVDFDINTIECGTVFAKELFDNHK